MKNANLLYRISKIWKILTNKYINYSAKKTECCICHISTNFYLSNKWNL